MSCHSVLKNTAASSMLACLTVGVIGLGLTTGASMAQTHTGDVEIWNSLCVGFDCPAGGPAYGDSTILMMENNTRIKFGDTSNSASFPRNDWEIEANASTNGGANYLGFNDCGTADNDGGCATDLVFAVEAGARQSALYVESDGDIGIGTNNPVVDLHVVTGNTPTLRLDQNGSSGFNPQVWDVAGNETNFFIRDVTNGSTLPFRIRPDAPTSSIDIAASGNVGIGTASPVLPLHVRTTGSDAAIALQNGTSAANFNLNWASNDTFRMSVAGSGQQEFLMDASGNVTITGTLTTAGSCSVGCDRVFDADYELPSIEEHAALMWNRGYLPNVGATSENAPVNLSDKTGRLLNELEHAHIYIEQLNQRVKQLEAILAEEG